MLAENRLGEDSEGGMKEEDIFPAGPGLRSGKNGKPRPGFQATTLQNLQNLKETSMRKCHEVMTKNPVVCMPGDLASKVAQIMKREDVGPVPIVESEQSRRLIGMVTDRDLAVKMVAEGRDVLTTKIDEVMTRRLVTCRADDDVQKALEAMGENQLRRIPVVDADDRIVGIIAQADLATRLNEPQKTADVIRKISQSNAD
jgi:CBS domain-containing protein